MAFKLHKSNYLYNLFCKNQAILLELVLSFFLYYCFPFYFEGQFVLILFLFSEDNFSREKNPNNHRNLDFRRLFCKTYTYTYSVKYNEWEQFLDKTPNKAHTIDNETSFFLILRGYFLFEAQVVLIIFRIWGFPFFKTGSYKRECICFSSLLK